MTEIEFFYKGKTKGQHEVIDGSNSIDRYICALKHGVRDYDRFVLDNGRVEGVRIYAPKKDTEWDYSEIINGERWYWKIIKPGQQK